MFSEFKASWTRWQKPMIRRCLNDDGIGLTAITSNKTLFFIMFNQPMFNNIHIDILQWLPVWIWTSHWSATGPMASILEASFFWFLTHTPTINPYQSLKKADRPISGCISGEDLTSPFSPSASIALLAAGGALWSPNRDRRWHKFCESPGDKKSQSHCGAVYGQSWMPCNKEELLRLVMYVCVHWIYIYNYITI